MTDAEPCSTGSPPPTTCSDLEAVRVSAARQIGRDHRAAEVAGRRWTPRRAPPRRRRSTRFASGHGAIADRKAALETPSSSASSRPRRSTCRSRRQRRPRGTVHPVSQVMDELAEIFADLGFSVAEGPEIETQWYNFTALNMPENHPARAMQDTFYLRAADARGGAARAPHAHLAGADPRRREAAARRST